MERLQHHVRRQAGREAGGGAGDLGLSREEHQHPALRLRQGGEREVGRGVLEAGALPASGGGGPVEPAGLDRMGAALGGQDRRVVHQGGDGGGVEGGRHHHEAQVRTQRGAHLQREREPEVGLQPALVELVEDDAADAGQVGIGLQHPGEDAFGDDLDAAAGDALAADAVADAAPRALAEVLGQPLGGGAGGDPARLQHQDAALDAGFEQVERHAGGLAGAGRGLEHRAPRLAQGAPERGQDRLDRQGRGEGGVHPWRAITARPKLVGASMRSSRAVPPSRL